MPFQAVEQGITCELSPVRYYCCVDSEQQQTRSNAVPIKVELFWRPAPPNPPHTHTLGALVLLYHEDPGLGLAKAVGMLLSVDRVSAVVQAAGWPAEGLPWSLTQQTGWTPYHSGCEL